MGLLYRTTEKCDNPSPVTNWPLGTTKVTKYFILNIVHYHVNSSFALLVSTHHSLNCWHLGSVWVDAVYIRPRPLRAVKGTMKGIPFCSQNSRGERTPWFLSAWGIGKSNPASPIKRHPLFAVPLINLRNPSRTLARSLYCIWVMFNIIILS